MQKLLAELTPMKSSFIVVKLKREVGAKQMQAGGLFRQEHAEIQLGASGFFAVGLKDFLIFWPAMPAAAVLGETNYYCSSMC